MDRYPPRPASRLEVQRHYLEDKRAGYARMALDARDDRENRLATALRVIRTSVATLMVPERRRSHQKPVAEVAPLPEPVDTAASAS